MYIKKSKVYHETWQVCGVPIEYIKGGLFFNSKKEAQEYIKYINNKIKEAAK